ncbi:MAG: hypothetical protein FGF53_06455 [Candidatus Brockarchaeota archaeon]|nr:hypothetical protein [Candidatus Brockarchaeota archaeon]MBO3809155.1 hypothetical protein [Candidatus Brockarchaeota archaeon]
MGEYFLTVCYKREKESDAEKELHDIALHSPDITDELFGLNEFEVLWKKGLQRLGEWLTLRLGLE